MSQNGSTKCPNSRDVHKAFLGKTETLKPETEALTIQAETEIKAFRARDRDEAEAYQLLLRLDTEVSRPRPHPCQTLPLTVTFQMSEDQLHDTIV